MGAKRSDNENLEINDTVNLGLEASLLKYNLLKNKEKCWKKIKADE